MSMPDSLSHWIWEKASRRAFHIWPDGTPLSNSYQMEYHLVEYERPTYFQLSIAYADINYCFADFNYAERYVSIPYELNYYKYMYKDC